MGSLEKSMFKEMKEDQEQKDKCTVNKEDKVDKAGTGKVRRQAESCGSSEVGPFLPRTATGCWELWGGQVR